MKNKIQGNKNYRNMKHFENLENSNTGYFSILLKYKILINSNTKF